MPEFYTIFARKIVFARIWGERGASPTPMDLQEIGTIRGAAKTAMNDRNL